jgi:hypothetical protein
MVATGRVNTRQIPVARTETLSGFWEAFPCTRRVRNWPTMAECLLLALPVALSLPPA